jgi:nucleoside-diphosphate-sugar epimerase
MRVFITGASGYIGFAVCGAVKHRGHDAVGLVRSAAAVEKLLSHGMHPVQATLADHKALREMTHDADAVIHCAFEQSPQGAELESRALDVMLGAIDSDHQAFIYTSGCWVYGDTRGKIADESAPLDPTPLVAWRPSHEKKVHNARKHKLRTIVVRPGLVYGNGGGIPGMLVAQAKADQLVIAGDGENHWATIRVDALAELYALALERAPAGAHYNAGNGDVVTYGEIARAASRAAGKDGQVDTIPLEQARKTMGPFADALALDQQISSARAQLDLQWDPDRPTVLEELANTTIV